MGEEVVQTTKKRKPMGHKKNSKSKKNKLKNIDVVKPRKIDKKLKKMLMKKARDYNSDTDDDDDNNNDNEDAEEEFEKKGNEYDRLYRGEEEEDEKEESDGEEGDRDEFSEDEDGEIQPGIMKFVEGCKAFRMAFRKVIKKTTSDDVLGPVLSAHKKLVAEKLAEEEVERKAKGEAKKEKHLVGEKGHVKPANYLDSHEKFLISVATKGVVKLFNAVNKAQHAQKGLNPLRAKDEKVIKKRRKEVFFSELGKNSSQPAGITSKGMQVGTSTGTTNGERLGWAPLRDDFMLTNSKLKDWDKKQDTTIEGDSRMSSETDASSDED